MVTDRRRGIEWCEQILIERTCRDSDGSLCENYPCKFLKEISKVKSDGSS